MMSEALDLVRTARSFEASAISRRSATADSYQARRDFDEALRCWGGFNERLSALHAFGEGRSDDAPSALELELRQGLPFELVSSEVLLGFRIATTWALGTRTTAVPEKIHSYALWPSKGLADPIFVAMLAMVNPWQMAYEAESVAQWIRELIQGYRLDRMKVAFEAPINRDTAFSAVDDLRRLATAAERQASGGDGFDNLAQMVVYASDYVGRAELLKDLDPWLLYQRDWARSRFFRWESEPVLSHLTDLLWLSAREVVTYGPAIGAGEYRFVFGEDLSLGESENL